MTNTLYLGAHPDDVEFGCAGTIAKLREKENAFIAVFSLCGKNSGLNVSSSELKAELLASAKTLKISEDKIFICDFENTKLPDYSHEIRAKLEWIRNEIKPSKVYMPSLKNGHQDHTAVSFEALRVFKRKEELRCYELPSDLGFSPHIYVDITDSFEEKVKALSSYASQVTRPYMRREVWETIARYRGYGSSVLLAEAFELIKRVE
jgi:LmbE family N-acetylglucosaminyl deacetylase